MREQDIAAKEHRENLEKFGPPVKIIVHLTKENSPMTMVGKYVAVAKRSDGSVYENAYGSSPEVAVQALKDKDSACKGLPVEEQIEKKPYTW